MSGVDGSFHAWHGVAVVLWCAVGVWHVGLIFEPTKQTAWTDRLYVVQAVRAAYDHAFQTHIINYY
jgi:hypothetical protein